MSTKFKSVNSTVFLRPTVLAAVALFTVGCGGSGGGGSDDSGNTSDSGSTAGDTGGSTAGDTGGNTTGTGSTAGDSFPAFQGVFGVNEQRIDGIRTLKLNAGFLESSDRRVFAGHQFLLGEDRCQEVLGGTALSPPDNISAGEVLVLSNPEGTLAQLDERGGFFAEDYSLQLESITAEQTMGMTLDIPGDEYPGFSTISVQDLDELTGIQPDIGSAITGQTQFGWVPSVHANTIVGLEMQATIAGIGFTTLRCTLVDDGEFMLPQFFQDYFGESITTAWSMSRSLYVDHFENGAYLEVSRTISTDTE